MTLRRAHSKKTIQELKAEYVAYYADVPVQKYAAMYISRDEDTVIRWRKKDAKFADAILKARAEWVRKNIIKTKAEFALERLEREIFLPSEPAANLSIYAQTVSHTQGLDPNAPENKSIVDETLSILLEKTQRKSIPTNL